MFKAYFLNGSDHLKPITHTRTTLWDSSKSIKSRPPRPIWTVHSGSEARFLQCVPFRQLSGAWL